MWEARIYSSVADGKVKVELGDDPDYGGIYSFRFTLNNLTDADVPYELSADFFTQNITGSGSNQKKAATIVMLSPIVAWTVNGVALDSYAGGLPDLTGDDVVNSLDAQAILDLCAGLIEAIPVNADKADIDGDGDVDTYDAHLILQKIAEAQSGSNQVVVPAEGQLTIGVTVDLKDAIEPYSVKGNYVEGYVNAREVVSSGEGVDHSIPVLGYFGSWTDPSMFNKGSYLEYTYGGETRTPYLTSGNYAALAAADARKMQSFLIRYAGQEFGVPMGGNPVVAENYYDPDRTAIAPAFGDEIFSVYYSALRNSVASRFRVIDNAAGEALAGSEILGGRAYGAYFNDNDYNWYSTNAMPDINYFLPDSVPNNSKLTLSFELAPEYYLKADGSVDWDAMHDGARITLPVTVDNEEPAITDVALAVSDINGGKKLLITARDNQYIARFRLLLEDGTVLLSQGSDRNAAVGDAYSVSYDISDPDAAHYLVEVTDYALNVGTYRINLNKEELEEPEISISLDKTDFEIIGRNSTSITATVNPWGVDDAVTWSSSDPAVATVNGRGVVTGVETGTAVITATSVAYPEVSATATVHVRFIEKTLNGIVCDENGASYVIEFNMRELPAYTTLHEEPLSDWVYETAIDRDGTVYVSTYDGSNKSPLYTLDLDSMTLTQLGAGTNRTYYTDIDVVGDALYSRNLLVGVYSTNLYTINKANGNRASQISMRNYTGSGSLVGISFYKTEGETDHFFVLTQSGVVYDVGLYVNNNAVAVQSAQQVLDFGYTADTNYWQDLYYDGESLYWSRIDLGISRVDLIMAENFTAADKETNIIRAGSFAVDVWPVGGLFELSKVPGYTPPAPEPDPEPGPGATGEDLYNPGSGSLHAISTEAPEDAAAGKLIRITADEPTTNGLITVEYPETVSFISAESEALKAVQAGEGKVVLAYAQETAIPAGELVAVLNFSDDSLGEVTITTNERNNEHPEDAITIVELGGSAPLPPEPAYTGPSWSWSDDWSMANAVFTAQGFADLVLPAQISVERVEPSCTENGSVVYTAEVVYKDVRYTDVKTEVLPAPGHVYGEPVWAWAEDCSAASVTLTCSVCGAELVLEAGIEAVITEPDCTEAGQAVYTAVAVHEDLRFEDVKTVELEALGHALMVLPGVAPSCTEPGLTEGAFCARCGETLSFQEEIEPLGHDIVVIQGIPATCTQAGKSNGSYCARCGEVFSEAHVLNPLGHAPVSVPGVEPSCTEPGLSDGSVCARCGEVLFEQEEIEPLGHQEEIIPGVVPSCTEPGISDGIICARCGEVLQEQEALEPLGHDPQVLAAVAPTCTASGLTEGCICGRCGEILVAQEIIPALGHTILIDQPVEPSCTEPGLTAGAHCPVCGETLVAQEEIPALGHDPKPLAAVAPGCTEPGLSDGSVCARCGEVLFEQEEIEPLGHQEEIIPGVVPSCTEPGISDGIICARCGEVLQEQEALQPLGHDPQVLAAVAPTCTTPGLTEGCVCGRCGEILAAQEILPALGHSILIDQPVEPSCTEPGLTAGAHCPVCGETLVAQEEIPALGHDPKLLAAVAPGCTEPGLTEGCVCGRCGEILTAQEEVPALGHDPKPLPGKEPTCTEPGLTEGLVRGRCGEILAEQIGIAALGHDYLGVITLPTCTLGGYTTYTCTRCDDSYAAEQTPPLGHSYGEPAWTWAEDNSIALASFVCSVCGDAKLLTAEITEEIVKPATELEEGEKKLTAKVLLNGVEYTDEKLLPIEKLEHDCPCAAFVDMPEFGTPEHEAIDWAYTHQPQLTAGTDSTHFSPDKELNRATAMTFLWAAAGKPAPKSTANPFKDVSDKSYYYKAVLWAVEKGITSGTSATTFSPKDTVTLAQMITFLWAAEGRPKPGKTNNPFSDISSKSYYYKPILWAHYGGILIGNEGSGGCLRPKVGCTRAYVMAYLYNYYVMTNQGK